MKIDNKISFGQTYLMPSIKYLSKNNYNKLFYSYGLGELYPLDIFLGGTRCGDLTVQMKPANLWSHLILNNQIPITPENFALSTFLKAMDNASQELHGPKIPVKKYKIKLIDYMNQEEIGREIHKKIGEYLDKFSKYFIN